MTKKLLLRLSLGLVVFIMIVLILTPLLVRKMIVHQSKEWIGRSISLEKLRVNYFTGTVKLMNFHLYEDDDSTVFIGFDTLIIDTEPYRFINNDIVIEQLYLKGLETNVVMYDSTFNFYDLLAFHQIGDNASTTDTTSGEPLKFELSNLELKGAEFTVRDAAIDKQMELQSFDFFVPYISWDQEHHSEAGLRFDFKNGGFFESGIDINPSTGDYDANIRLSDLEISGYTDFVKKYAEVGRFEGHSGFDINLSGNIGDPGKVLVNGRLSLDEFILVDQQDRQLFGANKIEVVVEEADAANKRILVDSVLLVKPSVYFEVEDSTNNLTDYIDRLNASMISKENDTLEINKTETATNEKLYYAVNKFIIRNATVDVVDRRTDEPFKYHLSQLEMRADSISSGSTWVQSTANMLLNNRGKLVAQIGVNPANPLEKLYLQYTITDFMLSDLNIYSRYYMGFPILYGDMYYKAATDIDNGQISSENKLIIHNVELGEKGGGLYDLPLKFALFLLKDKDGVISLDVPVGGDLKDPKVSVGKIVWNTFKNLIIKAAAAPVNLLSGLIGADSADIKAIEYDLMDTTFTEKRQRQLDLLLQLEQQKPELEIELVYFNDPDLEKQEIAMALVGSMYEENGNNQDYKTEKEEFEKFVFREALTDSMSVEDACMMLAVPNVVDSIAIEFNRKRSEDLLNYLHLANDSTEILVISFKPDVPKNIGSKPRFEVKYGMKEEKLP